MSFHSPLMPFGPGALRLVLASIVVAQHLSRIRIGMTAVMVFFMLSGFWVTRMYLQKHAGTARPIGSFYLSRFLRIWPPFAVAVILSLGLMAAFGAPADPAMWLSLPLLGTATHDLDPLSVSWSLDVELQFYLLLPLLLLAPRALSAAGSALAGLLVVAVGWWLFFRFDIETVAAYLPAFLAGVAIALTGWRTTGRAALGSLGLFAILGLVFYLNDATQGLVVTRDLERPVIMAAHLAWAMVLTPFVAWNVRQSGGRLDRHFGDFSYSLYLCHYPVIVLAKLVVAGPIGGPEKVAILIVATLVSVAFYLGVDRPLERWRAAKIARLLASGATGQPLDASPPSGHETGGARGG